MSYTVQRMAGRRAPAPGAPDFSTNFPATEGKISQGGIWTNGSDAGAPTTPYWQDVQTTPGLAFAVGFAGGTFQGGEFDDDIAHLSTSYRVFTPNQFSEGTISRAGGYSPTTNHEVELHTRFLTTSHNARGYETIVGISGGAGNTDPYIAIVRWNGGLGAFDSLYDSQVSGPTPPAPADGDVYRSEIVGNIITVYRNGTAMPSASVDITAGSPPNVWSSGQPGIGFWPRSGGNVVLASFGWKSWRAGNL